MNTTYPVMNPGFAQLGRPRLGIGPMSQSDIDSLENDAFRLLEEAWFEMSADSQMAMQAKKDECLDWIEDAKRDREIETYTAATTCLAEARTQITAIIEEEQGIVEGWPAPEQTCPEGWTSAEEG